MTMLIIGLLAALPVVAGANGLGLGRLHRERMEIGRALVEINATNWTAVLPYLAEDYEYHDPIVDIYGPATMAEFLGRLFGSSSDLYTTVEDETLVGGVYMATWTMAGQFNGVPFSAPGMSIVKFRENSAQAFYSRDYYTEGDIMANIPGLDEAVAGFRTFYRCAVDPTFVCPLESAAVAVPPVLEKTGNALAQDNPGIGRNPWLIRKQRLEIGRALLEVQSANWPSVLAYYADDIEYHDPIVDINGIGMMTQFLARLFGSSPDLVTTIEDETLRDGVYAATWTMVGQFAGVPYDAKGISIIKFRDRSTQVFYQRDYYTEGDIMAGIPGLDEAIAGFRTYYRCAVDPTFVCPLPPSATLADAAAKAEAPRAATGFALRQNAPNPFNPVTGIAYSVPGGGAHVSLRVFDARGRLVRTLVDGYEPGGDRTASWFGRDDRGLPVASGIYYYQLTARSFSEMRKMVLLK
jgi:hypothetical protein